MAEWAALWRAGLLSPRTAAALGLGAAREGPNPAALLAAGAWRYGDRTALDDGVERVSYMQLATEVRALAAGLRRDHGLGPGRRIALLGSDGVAFVRALFAATRTGADVVLLNPDWTAAQLAALVARVRIDLLLHDADLATGLPVPRATLTALTPGRARLPRARGGGVAVMTGGTTGQAKMARRRPSPVAFARSFAGLVGALDLGRHRRGLNATPLHHGFGLAALFVGLALGQTLHLRRRAGAAEAKDLIAREGLTIVTLVPTLLDRLLRAGALDRIGCVVCGGAPLSPALAAAVLDRCGPVLHNLYGTSEGGVATLAGPADLHAAPGSVGRALPGVRLRIADAEGAALPVGETGRVLVKSPVAVARDWQDTGDLGHIDAAGRLTLRGRADDMIVSGGENVYPDDVAAALRRHPAVAAAAAVGVGDASFGQRLIAFVEPAAPVTAEALTGWLAGEVARHERPRALLLLDALPLTPLGKVDLRRLRTLAASS
ncbi:class I adenylate-forming enzyme family protein [Sphingomonas sp.]|uniref:class I adenylate-forming enzyme family protein n=1 Tax=Sphingomonas sp. TaxID=28214 RepID=UPI003CC5D2BB